MKSQQLAIAKTCLTGPCERSRLLVTGGGRAGKTSLCRSLQNLDFMQTDSTVGIDSTTLEVNINLMTVNSDSGTGSGGWAKHTPPEKETEFALAKQIMKEQRRLEDQMKNKKDGDDSGGGKMNHLPTASSVSTQSSISKISSISGGGGGGEGGGRSNGSGSGNSSGCH